MSHRDHLVLGIDGGGTRTNAILARLTWLQDESGTQTLTEHLGRGHAGPSNPRAVGSDAACASLDEAIAAAFASAGLSRTPVASVVMGISGAGRRHEQEVLSEWARQRQLSQRIQIVDDAEPLLWCHEHWRSQPGCGLALVSGTGAIVVGRDRSGKRIRCGGWGWLLDDAGSGYAIGRSGLNAVLQQFDGRLDDVAATAGARLRQRLLSHLRLEQADGIVEAVYGSSDPRRVISGCAPPVLEAARQEDPLALKIIMDAADALSDQVVTVQRQLDFEEGMPLVMAGGVLLNHPDFCSHVLERIRQKSWLRMDVTMIEEAAVGCLHMASAMIISDD